MIGELIALVLPGWTQLTPRNKIEKDAKRKRSWSNA